MKTIAKLALALGLLAGVATAAEALVILRVGSVASSRFSTGWTLDGGSMTATRAKLLNAANFGPGGIDLPQITISDTAATVDSVNAALLADFDVFFIGYLRDANANAFTPAELAAFQKWVYEGGTMIVTCDAATHDAVCAYFGHPVSAGVTAPSKVAPTVADHPVFNGPFGTVSSLMMSGTQAGFGPAGSATVLAYGSGLDDPATILVQRFGAGKIVFLSDVDMISNFTLSAGASMSNQNDYFLGNLFSFAGSITPVVGLWWNPAESGSGYNIDIKHNVMVVTTYSYKPSGDSEWYISSGVLLGNIFTGVLLKARNGQCISCAYPGLAVPGGSDGSITITFSSPTSGTAFLPGGRVVPIQPQPF
jgi:hypothetical protein